MLESTALQRNLEETAVEYIEHAPKFKVLKESVKNFQGVSSSLDHLLKELHHPFLNWSAVTIEWKSFSIKNIKNISQSPHAAEAFNVLTGTFFDLIEMENKREEKGIPALESLLTFFEKFFLTIDDKIFKDILPDFAGHFERLNNLEDVLIRNMALGYHPFSKIVLTILKRKEKLLLPLDDNLQNIIISVLYKEKKETLLYWMSVEDPEKWLTRIREKYQMNISEEIFYQITTIFAGINHYNLNEILKSLDLSNSLKEILDITGHLDVVRYYREIPKKIEAIIPNICAIDGSAGYENKISLFFQFHILEIEGLASIQEDNLRSINKMLISMVRCDDQKILMRILPESFSLLKEQMGAFPKTALQCIEALGTEILKNDAPRLIELFLDEVIDFGFQTPAIKGVDIEWHVLSNPAHLQNIRAWLKLFRLKPKACSSLLSALLVNLKLGGVCVRDTDLFQKDITYLLNSDIEPFYNIVRQFAKTLPVYFNEIGAEGLLRDVSTEMDELTKRKDILIHFLRKQAHVESNNLIVDFVEALFVYYYSAEKKILTPYLPKEILEQIEPEGVYFDYLSKLTRFIAQHLGIDNVSWGIPKILNLTQGQLLELIEPIEDVSKNEKERFKYLVQMLRLVYLKYRLDTQEIKIYLQDAVKWGFTDIEELLFLLDSNPSPEEALKIILNHLEKIKEVILSKEEYEIREDIYYKRHIAVDIPSVYGRYHEKKFDALGISFRLENLVNIYFERLISDFDIPFVTKSTIIKIEKYLELFHRAIKIEGIHSNQFNTYMSLLAQSLNMQRFNFSQYVDIVRGLSEGVKEMINRYYISPHMSNITRIVAQMGIKKILPKYAGAYSEDINEATFVNQVAERLLRDFISASFGLKYLDLFVAKIFNILNEEKDMLGLEDLDIMMTFEPEQSVALIYKPLQEIKNLIHLGNKGLNLVYLSEEGISVPPGAIITTEVFRCQSIIRKFPRINRDFKQRLKDALRLIEEPSNAEYGNPSSPLLLSVRSGAAISMPGMMATIINVGSNLDIIQGLAKKKGNTWFAWDNYRRFLQSWAMAHQLNRDIFNELMLSQKRKYGVKIKKDFTGEQMRELALMYKKAVQENGILIEEDPFEQLIQAIYLVMNSWNSSKARAFREILNLSDFWGTAVIFESMKYGNLSQDSGTGVVLTANPWSKLDRICLWGDYTPGNQGEDIVSGLVDTHPISIEQKEILNLENEISLEEKFPLIYNNLFEYAKKLVYYKKWSHQEIEFTFEGPEPNQLFVLQSRNMTTQKKRPVILTFAPDESLSENYLGRGIGIGGGALSGKAVFTLSEIERLKENEPATSLILITSDTVPEDIKKISLADGLLTAKGGQTSHAAIVALRLGKTCVVGCKLLEVYSTRSFAVINGKHIYTGDYISIDGNTGSVYFGKHIVKKEELRH